jgi:hypothetical protein
MSGTGNIEEMLLDKHLNPIPVLSPIFDGTEQTLTLAGTSASLSAALVEGACYMICAWANSALHDYWLLAYETGDSGAAAGSSGPPVVIAPFSAASAGGGGGVPSYFKLLPGQTYVSVKVNSLLPGTTVNCKVFIARVQ